MSPRISNASPVNTSVDNQTECPTQDEFKQRMDAIEKQVRLQESKSFKCDFCDVPPFSSNALLEEHWLDIHPFGCTLCSKRYKIAQSIRRHLQETHGKREIFLCHRCNIPFFSRGDRKKHLPCDSILRRKVQHDKDIQLQQGKS